MIYIIHETLKERIPAAKLTTLTDHQTFEWWSDMEYVKENEPWLLNVGRNHKIENLQFTRDVDSEWLTYDIHSLDFIIDELKIDIAIVNTCLTHDGKKLKMIMAANDYQEYY
jgi:hypothetical protein